jgi:hypothetical protein
MGGTILYLLDQSPTTELAIEADGTRSTPSAHTDNEISKESRTSDECERPGVGCD